jgi:hypothetical protein
VVPGFNSFFVAAEIHVFGEREEQRPEAAVAPKIGLFAEHCCFRVASERPDQVSAHACCGRPMKIKGGRGRF